MSTLLFLTRASRARLWSSPSCLTSTSNRGLIVRHMSKHSKPQMFEKILIANRGEIACRVMQTAKRMGVKTVAVFSDADKNAMHVAMADQAYNIGPAPAAESYLRKDRILDVARKANAQAIHPGYGFLSENAEFADLCQRQGVVFIGPPAQAIVAMGSKSESKKIMTAAKVPVVPGYHGENQDPQFLAEQANRIGYPVLIKAVSGGGGKGMRIVHSAEEFQANLESSKREAMKSFSDDKVLVEKYIKRPRHIEFQVFADALGNCVYLFERDCSVQRRHQKVLEEAPAPGLSAERRAEMGKSAVNAARAVGYVGAGTVEFIMDEDDGSYYFMEMNTRLQVEHPVTEMVTGLDLVDWQLQVASGFPLPKTQAELVLQGHAFEARVYSERPERNFLPGTGSLVHLRTPEPSADVRIETGVRQGDEISIFYDPMIAKLVVRGPNRDAALRKLQSCLDAYQIVGLPTNIEFLRRCVSHPAFIQGGVNTNFIDTHKSTLLPPRPALDDRAWALVSVATLLNEWNRNQQNRMRSSEPDSPWELSKPFRVNGTARRELRFKEELGEEDSQITETDVVVSVRYVTATEFELTMPGSKQAIQASGSLTESGQMVATIDGSVHKSTVVVDNGYLHVIENHSGATCKVKLPAVNFDSASSKAASGQKIVTPMPGKVVKVLVGPNAKLSKGTPIMILEAMKMEHVIKSPGEVQVDTLFFKDGDFVEDGKTLVSFVTPK